MKRGTVAARTRHAGAVEDLHGTRHWQIWMIAIGATNIEQHAVFI